MLSSHSAAAACKRPRSARVAAGAGQPRRTAGEHRRGARRDGDDSEDGQQTSRQEPPQIARYAPLVTVATGGVAIVPGVLANNAHTGLACLTLAMAGLELTVPVAWALCLDIAGDYAGSVTNARSASSTCDSCGTVFCSYTWFRPMPGTCLPCKIRGFTSRS